MKRLLAHPSMPLAVGGIVLVAGGALLAASVFAPQWFARATTEGGERVELIASTVEQVVLEGAKGTSTAALSGSHVLRTRDRLVAEGGSFIEADLTAMQMRVYRNGQAALEVPIKGKGKVGSWWETPVGVYAVSLKKENHFSSFGHVYQPWSIVFQGNYFIHGWPYYPGGEPVSTSYSGGCIRLEDQYAEQVYQLAEVGMPVLVYKQPVQLGPLEALGGDPDVGSSFVAVDVTTGTGVRASGDGEQVPMGPALNLLVALTATDYVNVESSIGVGAGEGSPRLAPLSSVSVLDLLRLLLSEGDPAAARAVASYRGEEAFVRYMNAKAKAIGMSGTSVANLDAASPDNRTTLSDVALLARYLAENRSFVLQLTKDSRGNLAYDPPAWADLRHDPALLALPGFVGGVSPGSGSSLPAVAVVKVGEEGRPFAVAVGGSADPDAELAEVVRWLQQVP